MSARRAFILAVLSVACGGDPRPRAADSARPTPVTRVAPTSAAAPAPLGERDFAVGELHEGLDTAAVRRLLGAPDSVKVEDNPYDPGGKPRTWRYRDVTIELADETVYGIALDGPGVATARGLRVGDPADRVRALYGAVAADGDDWEYTDPANPGMHVVRVTVKGGRVAAIYVGSILD